MKYEIKEIVPLYGKEYIIIAKTILENNEYMFTNELKDGENGKEVTENYVIFQIDNDKAVNLKDEETANKLIPIFQQILKKQIDEIMKEGE